MRRQRWIVGLGILSIGLSMMGRVSASPWCGTNRLGIAVSGRWQAGDGSLLVDYFQVFLNDRDVASFRDRVAARYTETALRGILADSPFATARRAAVVSLGLLGSFERSNSILGQALRDSDPAVRTLAEEALWAVWFRAATPENNRALQHVLLMISRGQLDRAEALATRIIGLAPNFAEAYNQRAIIYFHQGRFVESAEDCQRVLSRNPYHIGAISGLAQCQMQLNRPADALKTLRRALKLQPYSDALRETIKSLEVRIESHGSR
jgi:tetratricopeptide (TPR) repeat protein